MWIYFSLLFFGTPSAAAHSPVSFLSLSSALFVSLVHFFFIPSIRVIRIESFNKKFCSPAESAPFCEFKWKSGRESGRGWRPGGRRALLACKLKCCHLNANKTPPRVESSVEKEGGEQRRGRKRDRKRERENDRKFGGRERTESRAWQIARQRCLRGRRGNFERNFSSIPPARQTTPQHLASAKFDIARCQLSISNFSRLLLKILYGFYLLYLLLSVICIYISKFILHNLRDLFTYQLRFIQLLVQIFL